MVIIYFYSLFSYINNLFREFIITISAHSAIRAQGTS
jgi:hypothetical protein